MHTVSDVEQKLILDPLAAPLITATQEIVRKAIQFSGDARAKGVSSGIEINEVEDFHAALFSTALHVLGDMDGEGGERTTTLASMATAFYKDPNENMLSLMFADQFDDLMQKTRAVTAVNAEHGEEQAKLAYAWVSAVYVAALAGQLTDAERTKILAAFLVATIVFNRLARGEHFEATPDHLDETPASTQTIH